MKYTITTWGNVGDIVCMISAAHTFARVTRFEVYVEQMEDVIRCYGDGLLKVGKKGVHIHLNVADYHRLRAPNPFRNYLGTFLRPLMHDDADDFGFELPDFETGPARCLLQPFAKTAKNPTVEFVQALVDQFHAISGEQLYVIGNRDTPKLIRGVDYSLLEDSVPQLLGHISRARCVLTPRSASAHIAAGYQVPAFLWPPNDGENWHLDYPGWEKKMSVFERGIDEALESLVAFHANVLALRQHPGALRKFVHGEKQTPCGTDAAR